MIEKYLIVFNVQKNANDVARPPALVGRLFDSLVARVVPDQVSTTVVAYRVLVVTDSAALVVQERCRFGGKAYLHDAVCEQGR